MFKMSDRICFSLPWRFPPTFGKRITWDDKGQSLNLMAQSKNQTGSEHVVSSNVIEQTTVLKKDAQDALDQYEKAFIAKRCELRSQHDSVNIVSSNKMEKTSDSQYQATEKEKEIQELLETLAKEFRSEDSREYQVEQNAKEKDSDDNLGVNQDLYGIVSRAEEHVSGEVQIATSNESK